MSTFEIIQKLLSSLPSVTFLCCVTSSGLRICNCIKRFPSPSSLSPEHSLGSCEAFGRVDSDPRDWYNLILIEASVVKSSYSAWEEAFKG